jgi:hypothetical protein
MSNLLSSRRVGVAIALALTAAAGVAMAGAAPKGPNTGAKPASAEASATSAAVEALATADALALYGIRESDPVALIQAAKMKKAAPAKALEAAKKTEGTGTKGADKATGYDLGADALLARAEGMSAGNATLQALIADAKSTKSRGATRGPTVHADTVLAGNIDSYTVTFRGGEQAAVLVSGDGDTDLDLYVTDENGNTICTDTDASDTMLCSWTPAWTGPFGIHVRNLGRVYNNYRLAVN